MFFNFVFRPFLDIDTMLNNLTQVFQLIIDFLNMLFSPYVDVKTLGRNKHPRSELIVLTKVLSKDLGNLPFRKS